MTTPTFLAQVILARKLFESLLSSEVKTVHVSLSKLMAEGSKSAWSIATYYTKGITMREIAVSSEALNAMVGYYAKAEHAEHGGPYARWYGSGVEALGLETGEEVTPLQMRRLLQLLDPHDGSRLPNNGGKKAKISAADLTYSLEKELGALWLLGDDTCRAELEMIADVAMNESLGWVQKEASVVRRGTDGVAHRSASGFVAIEVDHTTARPVEGLVTPHLHRHVVIINAAELDGKWTALDAERLFDVQKTAAEIAGQKVRELTSKLLGVTWKRDDNGVYRILGFDAGLRNKLSLRQNQILDQVLADGLDPTSRGDWVKAQRVSREGKNACGDDPEAAQWAIEMMAKEGINFDSVIGDMRQATKELEEQREQIRRDRRWIDTTFPPCPEDVKKAEAWRLTVARELATMHVVGTIVERVHNEPGTTLDYIPPAFDRLKAAMAFAEPPTQDEVAHEAMMNVGRDRATWRRKDLIAALTGSDVGLVASEKYARAFLKSNEVAYLWGVDDDPDKSVRVRTADQTRYATVETLEKEKAFVLATRQGVGTMNSLSNDEQFDLILEKMDARGKYVDPESDQYRMVDSLLRGTNQIQLLDGQAGSGKSAAIESLVIAKDFGLLGVTPPTSDGTIENLSLVGCSLTANAAEGLQKISGMRAFSITMLASRLDRGAITLHEGAIVVLDEMSQASTAQLTTLLNHVKAVNGRFVLTGNFRQLQAVAAGGLIPTLLETCPEAVMLLDETRRQENLEERAILAQMHYGGRLLEKKNRHAINALLRQGLGEHFVHGIAVGGLGAVQDWLIDNDRVVVHSTVEAATAAIASQYWDAVASSSEPIGVAAIVMARSNPEAAMLNHAIIEEAVNRGLLNPDETVEFGRREFLLHQRILLRNVDWDLDVRNGQSATVEGTRVVGTKWAVEFETPGPSPLTRSFKTQTKVGSEEIVRFSATQVAAERRRAATYLERRRALVAKSEARSTDSEATTKNKWALAEAEKWVAWANSLSDAGGSIPLVVAKRTRKATEKRLIINLDNGEERSLPIKYVETHVDGGYAITNQRAQGQTVDVGIEYNDISYVGMSRGRKNNVAHLVVAPPDDFRIEQDRLAIAETYDWLAHRLGPDETRNFIATNRGREIGDTTNSIVEISDGLTVLAVGSEHVKSDRIIDEIATSHVLGERRVGVVRSTEMASAMSDAVIKRMKEKDHDGVFVATLDGRQWVKNMPVIVARGELDGLEYGRTYYVAATSKNALFLEVDGGEKVKIAGSKVKSLDSGLVVTSGRVRAGIGQVDKLIAVASGLDQEQLNLLAEMPCSVEVILSDPDVTGAFEHQELVDKQIMEHLKKDSGTGWDSRSALDMLKWREGEEVGLKSLQAEVQMTAKVIDETRNLSARDLAVRDLEHKLIKLRKHLYELNELNAEPREHEELLDIRSSLFQVEGSIADASNRMQYLVRRDVSDGDLQVTREIAGSTEYHATDDKRMKDAEALLNNFVQIRVTKALRDPQPWHPSLDSELPAKEAYEQLQERLTVIEEYRSKWAVQDQEEALGIEPEEVGLQHDEYERAAELLRDEEALRREYEMSMGPTR